ncbi:MAG: PilZ domain-containing protein [Spirochaetaceae bacterium]|jgi:hypothetical protein|nr:PilZ domain-containing protein [Spirochaetaceae bacterium]
MKLLFVVDSRYIYKRIADCVKALGAEIVRYQHIVKAMDNIGEISPDGIVVSAADFPRHWKTLVSFVRSERTAESCAIAVLYGTFFPEKERRKAQFLNVNCLVNETRLDRRALNRLCETFRPYISADKWIDRSAVKPENGLPMIVTNPLNGALIPGTAVKISPYGVIFTPEQHRLIKNLALMTELPGCSIRVGGSMLSPSCRIIRSEDTATLEFTALNEKEKQILHRFLDGYTAD